MPPLKRYAVMSFRLRPSVRHRFRDMGASGYAVYDRDRQRIVSWHKEVADAKGKAERLNRG